MFFSVMRVFVENWKATKSAEGRNGWESGGFGPEEGGLRSIIVGHCRHCVGW